MDDLFGGDYGKAVEAHKNIQGLQTQTAQKLTESVATIADLQSQVTKLSATPTPTPPPTTNGGGSGGSLFEWNQQSVWNESGGFSDGAATKLSEAGVPKEFLAQAEALMSEGRQYRQDKYDTNISTVLGSTDNFATLNEWTVANKTPAEIQGLQSMLDNSSTAGYALQGLKAEFEASGGTFGTEAPKTVSTEPSRIPPTTGGGHTGMTPLRPNTSIADAQEVAAAYASRDTEAIKNVDQRVALGVNQP